MLQHLVALQDLDTARDRLMHRLDHLEEMVVATAAREQLMAWEQTAVSYRQRHGELQASIAETEEESARIDAQRARLDGQLRQAIAVREAEALQHEIAELIRRRSELDDIGLAALEELAEVESEMSDHAGTEESLRRALEESDQGLELAQSDLRAEVERLDSEREALRSGIEASWLQNYDRLRSQLGVVVVRLEGAECVGCPFQLSPGELQAVRDAPADSPVDCPQCGRLIVK
jgi:predicted  nucleic acid-binding Zn-ribbon protein